MLLLHAEFSRLARPAYWGVCVQQQEWLKALEHWIELSQHACHFGFAVTGGGDVVIQEIWTNTFGRVRAGRHR